MASQVILFTETIAGMKKAIKRKAYDSNSNSDSDSSIEQLTNRGNKLRKKARYVHEGQLAPPTGPKVYKRTIEHAGFRRDIISRNHPLVDDDGYEVDSDDDDERVQSAMAAGTEFDPYSGVKLEHLLAPLTSAADLPNHPTLAEPFLSKTLTNLTQNAGEMLQKERASLWRIKHLLTKLSGDHTWIACGSMETDRDIELFDEEYDRHRGNQLAKRIAKEDGDHVSTGTSMSEDSQTATGLLTTEAELDNPAEFNANPRDDDNQGDIMKDISRILPTNELSKTVDDVSKKSEVLDITKSKSAEDVDISDPHGIENPAGEAMDMDMTSGSVPAPETLHEDAQNPNNIIEGVEGEIGQEDQEEIPVPHRMRTRAQAQAASDNTVTSRTRSLSPDANFDSYVHPYFLAPQSSRPDRDLGLPEHEAEETRRLLQLYIQKQEEVCRGAQKVYDGLLKANRYRNSVMKWAKAEAHLGEMDDGEDWYDKEEWGLEENLKKGHDEEEEDAATTAKKTRTRRQ
ncbi:hypothetical protein B7494_g2218 [Chlorociboria aeruginascens]|nr:hypothetical protein B7494_g2218 [Chlorociboria aeruginascens]